MNNIKSIFPYEQIYQERKKERRLQQCEKRESGGCKFVGAGDNFSPRRRKLIKEALHKTMKLYTP